ncbi:hypothetical protein WR25_14533 [Diploscapter pachys]|uniref:Uncharacterized protein n=1 Tax=Diploscapter pachys TaxID=2018661 RepID=A0A2A2JUC5_9BILA|nr:hypothetical protein WR25_14533 [Diploscapter pachys]
MSPFQGGGGDTEGVSSRAKTSSSNPNSSSGQKRVTQADVERFAKALTEFQVPKESDFEAMADSPTIRKHPSPQIEEYFEFVAQVGIPCVSWDKIKPAFLWKIKFVMDEVVRVEKLKSGTQSTSADGNSSFDETYKAILDKAADFDGAPFTWQRICELLTTPARHYKKAEKFVRALDKAVNVVTTVTEHGERLTGADWIPTDELSKEVRIEQRFFGKVDELDEELEDLWDPNYKNTSPPVEVQNMEEEPATQPTEPLDMSTKKEPNPSDMEKYEDQAKRELAAFIRENI